MAEKIEKGMGPAKPTAFGEGIGGVNPSYKNEMLKIKAQHQQRVDDAVNKISKQKNISKQEALEKIIEHMKSTGIKRQSIMEEIHPDNPYNAGIFGYFLRKQWQELLK